MISTKKINLLRLILVFTALVLSINFISRIIGAKFDFVHFLNWETLIFEIGVEGILLILCALITYFSTWFIREFSFWKAILRVIVYALSYISLSFFFMLFLVEWEYLDLFSGFLNYFSSALKDGITFVFVWMIFDQIIQKTSSETKDPS